MADLTKLKRRSSLGKPPTPAEASANLGAPETAPPPAPETVQPPAIESVPAPRMSVMRSAARGGAGGLRRDGRSARRSGRTLQFATRVTPEFDERLRSIAERDGKLLVEVLEDALDAYEERYGGSDR
jgi:hypothetical protein